MPMMNTIRLLLLCSLTLLGCTQADDSWGYGPDNGPDTWPDTFPTCGGDSQSPIDIIDSTVVPQALGSWTLTEPSTDSASMTLTNTGHTAQVSVQGEYIITGSDLPSEYQVTQFHFHWGSTDDIGSEHKLNSKAYAVEIHIVSYDRINYESFNEAANYPDGVAVIGGFIEVKGEDNPAYSALVDALPDVTYKDTSYDFSTVFSILPMLSDDRDTFYRYKGSLTTPECNESVIWTVLKNPIYISEAQINTFRSLKFNAIGEEDDPMVNNYRPPQSLNGRTVYINDMESGGDGGRLFPSNLVIASVLSNAVVNLLFV